VANASVSIAKWKVFMRRPVPGVMYCEHTR
jgi:hypothetical protein